MAENLGKIHIYTGNGKGKTTAALGLAVRALGAGFRVCLIQFMKNRPSAEIKVLKKLPNIKIYRFGKANYLHSKGTAQDRQEAVKAWKMAEKIIRSRRFDVVILDEIGVANFFKLINAGQIINLLKIKPKDTEMILTGRKFDSKIIKLADYATEMKEISHPYQAGIKARPGIEY